MGQIRDKLNRLGTRAPLASPRAGPGDSSRFTTSSVFSRLPYDGLPRRSLRAWLPRSVSELMWRPAGSLRPAHKPVVRVFSPIVDPFPRKKRIRSPRAALNATCGEQRAGYPSTGAAAHVTGWQSSCASCCRPTVYRRLYRGGFQQFVPEGQNGSWRKVRSYTPRARVQGQPPHPLLRIPIDFFSPRRESNHSARSAEQRQRAVPRVEHGGIRRQVAARRRSGR